jgi:GT2 family glycosyltransferase
MGRGARALTSRLQISVVIPVRDAADELVRCLAALAESTRLPAEVVVVDDGSSVPVSLPAPFPVPLLLERLDPGRGPAAARNRGAAAATGEVLLFLDADVLVGGRGIEHAAEAFADPALDGLQGIYRLELPFPELATRYQNAYYHWSFRQVSGRAAAIAATYCFAVRRTVFIQAGGFDERIGAPTVEDEEFGYRLGGLGKRIVVDAGLDVLHLARYSVRTMLRRRFRMSRAQGKALLRALARQSPVPVRQAQERSHHPRGAVFSVALLLVALLALLAWPLVPGRLCPGLLILAGAGFILLQAPFWSFLISQGVIRPGRLLAAALLGALDFLVLGLGALVGAVDFATGRRY